MVQIFNFKNKSIDKTCYWKMSSKKHSLRAVTLNIIHSTTFHGIKNLSLTHNLGIFWIIANVASICLCSYEIIKTAVFYTLLC